MTMTEEEMTEEEYENWFKEMSSLMFKEDAKILVAMGSTKGNTTTKRKKKRMTEKEYREFKRKKHTSRSK